MAACMLVNRKINLIQHWQKRDVRELKLSLELSHQAVRLLLENNLVLKTLCVWSSNSVKNCILEWLMPLLATPSHKLFHMCM